MCQPGDEDETTFHARRAKAGDPSSLNWLVARLSPLLEIQARFRLGPTLQREIEPMDLVEDAWLVALQRIGDISPNHGRLTPSLMKFLANTIRNRIRELARRIELREAGRQEEADGDDFAAQTSSLLSRFARDERMRGLKELMSRLDEKDQQIVVMRGFEQMDNAEVARIVDLKPNTVAQRYHRALEFLRQHLPDSAFDDLS